ncbi:DNA polymerase III subunit delta' [Desulfogranum marinum]|uniref:DNA polymerase III subunit delta' n=1 Tax=Desulfogranum marinum TaxID=453220 RepID=UPI00196628F8|nr:DNA polymerase III subunit delta' [Desulfogranum marinum]
MSSYVDLTMVAFDQIRGQSKAKRLLGRALAGSRLSHAYLFSGPTGVGKATMAAAVADILLCESQQGDQPCGVCPGCAKMLSGNHPDYIRITPQGAAIKIDQIRALKEALVFSPFENGYRVIVLEDVHTMRREAGNSLLKLLEEPPPNNIFILIGSSAEALLSTIVSRCQVVPFFSLPLADAAKVITSQCPELEAENALMLAALADGCPGQALSLETEGLFEIYTRFVDRLRQPYPNEAVRVENALAFAGEISVLKEALPVLLRLFRLFFKEVMMVRVGGKNEQSCSPEVAAVRELWNLNQLSAKITAVDLAEKALTRNCNRGLVCEVLMLDLL